MNKMDIFRICKLCDAFLRCHNAMEDFLKADPGTFKAIAAQGFVSNYAQARGLSRPEFPQHPDIPALEMTEDGKITFFHNWDTIKSLRDALESKPKWELHIQLNPQ